MPEITETTLTICVIMSYAGGLLTGMLIAKISK